MISPAKGYCGRPRAVIKAAAPRGGAAAAITWGLRAALLRRRAPAGGDVAELRDGGHALSGEHAAALQPPVLVLLQQHRPNQASDGGVVGEDADDPGTALDLLVDPLQEFGAPDLFPVLLGEVAEGQHVLLGLMHEPSGLGEALRQRGGQITPAGLDLRSGFLGEHAAQGSGDHALVRFGDALQHVAGEVNAVEITKRTSRCDAARCSPAVACGSPCPTTIR